MQEITAYKPKCCNLAYMSKYSAIRHERNCTNNSDNRACQTCKHKFEEWETVHNRYHNGNPGSTDYDVKYWWCEHFEKSIDKYSGAFYDDEATMQPRMNCEFWEGRDGLFSCEV